MSKILLVLFIVLSFAVKAQIPTDSLKGYYSFNGTFSDDSGNDNDISIGSGTFANDRFDNPNGALFLNGTSDSLAFPISEFSPIAGDFAISFWYKTNSPKIINLFSSKQSASDTTNNFEVQLNSHNSYYLQYLMQSFYQTFVYWNGGGTSNNALAEGSPGAFTKGSWCHFVITRESDTLKIFRNHQLYTFSLDNYYGGELGDSVDLIFAAAPYPFKGSIDDLRLYSRSLNQSEIDLLWFENNPISYVQPKATDAYVQGSNVLVYWEYDATQISDSILVQYKINNGSWTDAEHSNEAIQNYLYIDLSYPPGTTIEVRVSDLFDTTLTNSTGTFTVSEYDWVEVASTLPFNPKDGAGLLSFQNKMWLLGGWDPPYHPPLNTHNEIWSSPDGAEWTFETNAPWPARHASAWLTDEEHLWVIGGDPQSGCLTDAWKSSDGINWTQTIDAIPDFEIRNSPNYAYFNDQLFIYGGEQCSGPPLTDVWTSTDGISWNEFPNAPWLGRGMQINYCVDGNGQMWMLGGSNEGTRRSYNEVWKTSDGINWTLVNESAPWAGRYWHTVAWFDNKMWLMGGMATGTEMNDVWYSEDGINWHELKSETGNWPAGSRHAQSTTVFNDALWYMCGILTNSSWKIINTTFTDVEEEMHEFESGMLLFPNPTNNSLNLSFSNTIGHDIQILLFDPVGALLKEIYISKQEAKENIRIDVSGLPQGIYSVQIKDNPGYNSRFIKQ